MISYRQQKARSAPKRIYMLATTIEIIRSGLKADPSLNPADRSRILATIRNSTSTPKTDIISVSHPRLVRRAEVARRLSCSLRTVDKLAASGVLRKRKLPGRVRAAGFLESDLNALLIVSTDNPANKSAAALTTV